MRQKTRSLKVVAAIVFIIAFAFMATACASTNQRVQEALGKVKDYSGVEIKGTANATVNIESLGQDMDIEYDYDIKIKDEDMVMVADAKTGVMDITIEMYMVDDTFLMRIPVLMDKYIDASDMLEQAYEEGIAMDLNVFDFDIESTELEAEEATIEFEGNDINVLKVQVLLNKDQLTALVKKLFAQQSFGADAISGQSLNAAASIYESIDVESASYTLYIDNNNNIKRYEVASAFTIDMQGQKAAFDIQMEYNIVNTGDSVDVALPEVDAQDIISINELNYNGVD